MQTSFARIKEVAEWIKFQALNFKLPFAGFDHMM
jgi:hypothetical protein